MVFSVAPNRRINKVVDRLGPASQLAGSHRCTSHQLPLTPEPQKIWQCIGLFSHLEHPAVILRVALLEGERTPQDGIGQHKAMRAYVAHKPGQREASHTTFLGSSPLFPPKEKHQHAICRDLLPSVQVRRAWSLLATRVMQDGGREPLAEWCFPSSSSSCG